MRRTLLTMTLFGGIVAAVGSLFMAAGLAVLTVVGRDVLQGRWLVLETLALAFGFVAPVLGLLAAWHASRGLADKPAAPFRLPAWGWLLLALVVVLAGGQALFDLGIEPAVSLSHILAATLASLLMLAIPVGAAQRHGWTMSRRAGVGGLAWGALGGAGLAMVVEMMLLAVLVIAAVLILTAINPAWVEEVTAALRLAGGAGDASIAALAPFLSSPLILLGGLLLGAVLVPLIEEFVKSLAIPLVHASGRTLTPLDAFLLGASAGAGFTLIEGITNGAMALSQPEGWATAMAARSGVAVIHVLASALAGLAWHTGLVQRRWGKALGLFAAAVALHGAWNGGALSVAWLGLTAGGPSVNLAVVAGSLLVPVIVASLGAAFVGSLVLLAALPSRLARAAPPPVEAASVEADA